MVARVVSCKPDPLVMAKSGDLTMVVGAVIHVLWYIRLSVSCIVAHGRVC